jgi:hypothetical protein
MTRKYKADSCLLRYTIYLDNCLINNFFIFVKLKRYLN